MFLNGFYNLGFCESGLFHISNLKLAIHATFNWPNFGEAYTFINEFIDELEKKGNNIKSINIIVVISKWDKSGKGYASGEELESFISERLPMTDNMIDAHKLARTYYTIGNVNNENGQERVTQLNLDTAEVLGKWLYQSITGFSLDYEGTFWERIKFSIFN